MRLYSEKEIGAILKRTAELSKNTDIQNADGLSLEELKQLASEAGLNPDLVVRAASELSPGSSMVEKQTFYGGPLSHATETELNVEIDQDTWESMLPIIRAHFKDPGIVQTRPGAFEWTGSGGWESSGKAHVSLQKTNGGSRLHIFWSEVTSAVPFFIPTILALVLSPAILFEELAMGLEGIPIWAALVATIFFISRFGVMSMKKRHVQKLDMLGQELTQIALQSSLSKQSESDRTRVERAQQNSSAQKGASIDLPDDEFEDRTDTGGSRRDRETS